ARSLRDRCCSGAVHSPGYHRRAAIAQSRDTAREPRVAVARRKIRAVIFDLGRVLIRVDIGRATKALGVSTSLSPADVWAAIEKDPRWPDLQEGRMSARDWHLHLSRKLGTALTLEQFTEAWNQALDPQPLQSDALFASLKKNYRL